MKKFIRNISALSICATMLLSGCAESKAPTEITFIDVDSDFEGNCGDVSIESGDTYAVITVADFGDIKIKLFPEAAPYAVKNFIKLAENGYYEGKNVHRVISDFMIQGGSLNGNGTGGFSAEGGEFEREINSSMRHFYGALCYANAAGKNTCQFYIVNNKTSQAVSAEYYTENAEVYSMQAEAYRGMIADMDKESDYYVYFNSVAKNYDDMASGFSFMSNATNEQIIEKYAEVGGVPFLDGGYVVFGQTVEGFDVIDKISSVEVTDNGAEEVSSPVKEITIEKVVIRTA